MACTYLQQLETDGDELQSEYFQLREELINSLTG